VCFLFIYEKLMLTNSSLKTEYTALLKELGSTGAGLDPNDIREGSQIANLIGVLLMLF
jgi:hypothetical protein